MPNKSYQRGSNFERNIQRNLEKQGYYCMRSAGSHTVIDVLAIKEDSILLIQCKTSNVESIPDIKQLFKSFESDGSKSNIKLFEEMKIPILGYGVCSKIIIWNGIGRNNTWLFVWHNNKWGKSLNIQGVL